MWQSRGRYPRVVGKVITTLEEVNRSQSSSGGSISLMSANVGSAARRAVAGLLPWGCLGYLCRVPGRCDRAEQPNSLCAPSRKGWATEQSAIREAIVLLLSNQFAIYCEKLNTFFLFDSVLVTRLLRSSFDTLKMLLCYIYYVVSSHYFCIKTNIFIKVGLA